MLASDITYSIYTMSKPKKHIGAEELAAFAKNSDYVTKRADYKKNKINVGFTGGGVE